MQTHIISFTTPEAASDALPDIHQSLEGRSVSIITLAPHVDVITPPVMDGIEIVTPGEYSDPVYRIEVNVFDDDPVPAWENAVVAVTSLALPVETPA